MSVVSPPTPVKPLAALFSADRGMIARAAAWLERTIGVLDYISEELPFDQTDYYYREMGRPLIKRFLAAETLIDPVRLVDIKRKAMDFEAETAALGSRTVNIDPGYISPERLVLATGKNFTHRIYLDRGIYADLTLIYHQGGFRTLPWTYPDYATEAVLKILVDIRNKYLRQLKPGKRKGPEVT